MAADEIVSHVVDDNNQSLNRLKSWSCKTQSTQDVAASLHKAVHKTAH